MSVGQEPHAPEHVTPLILPEVRMFKKAVFPGKYIQGVGAIDELPSLIKVLGKRALILASRSVKERVLPACGIDLRTHGIAVERAPAPRANGPGAESPPARPSSRSRCTVRPVGVAG